MTKALSADRLGGYLLSHRSHSREKPLQTGPAVTISREAGAGGSSVAARLAAYLEQHQSKGRGPWAVFDQNLVAKALEQHRLPGRLEQYMPEDAAHLVSDTVEDLLGLHPSASELVRRLAETMVSLARRGNVILVGRGGNLVTAKLPNVLHVRLVAPHALRVRHMSQLRNVPEEEAARLIARTDRARKRFLRQSFGAKIDDPLLYDLTVNMAHFTFDEAAAWIGELVLHRMPDPTDHRR